MDPGLLHADRRPEHLRSDCYKTHTDSRSGLSVHQHPWRQTYQCTQIVPDFGNVWIHADGPGVCIEGITILINLVIKDADRAPKRRVAPVAVNCLLVGLIGLGVFLLRHVTSTKQIPALRIVIILAPVSSRYRPEL